MPAGTSGDLSLRELLERSKRVVETFPRACLHRELDDWPMWQADLLAEVRFQELCDLLPGLQAAMVAPPNGFAEVAAQLRLIGRFVPAIRQGENPFDLGAEVELPTLVRDLNAAINKAGKAARLDDSLAFLDKAPKPPTAPAIQRRVLAKVQQLKSNGAWGTGLYTARFERALEETAAWNEHGIDSTPDSPLPPDALVVGAMRGIPQLMSDQIPRQDGRIAVVASDLVGGLQKQGHSRAASQWAIHRAVLDGRLAVDLVPCVIPGKRKAGAYPIVDGIANVPALPPDRRGHLTISKGVPTPFKNFKVVGDRDLLTAWWKLLLARPPEHLSRPVAAFDVRDCDDDLWMQLNTCIQAMETEGADGAALLVHRWKIGSETDAKYLININQLAADAGWPPFVFHSDDSLEILRTNGKRAICSRTRSISVDTVGGAAVLSALRAWLARRENELRAGGSVWLASDDSPQKVEVTNDTTTSVAPPVPVPSVPNKSDDGFPKRSIDDCKPSERKAYYSFKLAEALAEKRLEDREAYEYLTENDCSEQLTGELEEYSLPAFETWCRQLRVARNAANERKYSPRTHR